MSKTCSNCFQPLPEGTEVCPACGYDLRKDQGKYPLALPAGTVLNGQYILGRVLGQGGFGITYVAQDHRTGMLVAVKEYFPDTMATRSQGPSVSAYTGQREENFTYGKECFLNEAKTLAEFIGNPNIVRVYSYFEENNTAYFVMEYVQGTSFQDYLKDRGKISWQEAKWILFPVMEALAAVHRKGIVHRDVTPDNIYITRDGQVKLLDFGAARYSLGDKSRSLDVVLKHGFAPKEQYSRHGRQGPFTDVYALGATFYFAITGRIPPDSIDRQDEDDLILPSSLGVKIPVGVEDALCKALAVSAQDRFQNMGDFQLALRKGEGEEGTVVPPSPPPAGGDGDNGTQPSPPPTGGDGNGGTQPFPPHNEGGGNNDSKMSSLTPEKKKKIFIGGGVLAALLVVVSIAVFASSGFGNSLKVEPVSEDPPSSVSGQSNATVESDLQVASEAEVTLLPESGEETVRLRTGMVSYDESGAVEYSRKYEYDDWGNEIMQAEYQPDGSLESYVHSVYDTNGREIKVTYFASDGTITSFSQDIYEGNTGESYYSEAGAEPILTAESTFDDAGNELTHVSYYDDGSVDHRWEYEYDDAGVLTKETSYSYLEDGSLDYVIEDEYTYDSQGNVIKENSYHDGELTYVYEREFDEDGNELVEYHYDDQGELLFMTKKEYDSQGNRTFYGHYTGEGKPLSLNEYKYDEHGEMISEYSDDAPDDPEEDDETLRTYENEYDSNGNLVKQIVYKDGVLWAAYEYETRIVPTDPGGDPNLVPSTPEKSIPGSAPASSQAESSQPTQSEEFTGSEHGMTGAKFAIEDIKLKEGFVDRYSGFPCGGLVEVEGGPWFLALYELNTPEKGYVVYYSLYDLRGNGLVIPACEELFVPVGGNNGKVGIYEDAEGTSYLMVEKKEADGQTVYTSYSFTPITEEGLTQSGSYFASSEVNYDTGTGVFILGDTKTDESGLQEFLGKFTAVCSMDISGNYTGNVITFEDFVQNYT